VALFQAMDVSQTTGYLLLIRADESPTPTLASHVIAATTIDKNCDSVDRGSLAYDAETDKLFVVYGDGCANGDLMLVSSDDGGRTWTKGSSIASLRKQEREIRSPSLVAGKAGTLGLLWEEGWFSGRWMFSTIKDGELKLPPKEVSSGVSHLVVGENSISLNVAQSNTTEHGYSRIRPRITVNLFGILNDVWRSQGVVATKDKILAVWSSGNKDGMRLYAGTPTLTPQQNTKLDSDQSQTGREIDVTDQTAVLFGGIPTFEDTSGMLDICLTLRNNSSEPLHQPIKLEAADVSSSLGTVSILNATNHAQSAGATWDVGKSLTGDRIPPHGTTNPFCLSFHLEFPPHLAASPTLPRLLTLNLSVWANQPGH